MHPFTRVWFIVCASISFRHRCRGSLSWTRRVRPNFRIPVRMMCLLHISHVNTFRGLKAHASSAGQIGRRNCSYCTNERVRLIDDPGRGFSSVKTENILHQLWSTVVWTIDSVDILFATEWRVFKHQESPLYLCTRLVDFLIKRLTLDLLRNKQGRWISMSNGFCLD